MKLNNGEILKLKICDIPGQERYRTVPKSYFLGSKGIILMFDKTNKNTLDNINVWFKQIKEVIDVKDVCLILVGNKVDLVDKIKVSKEDALSTAKELEIPYFETSALTGENIGEAMCKLSENIFNKEHGVESHNETNASEKGADKIVLENTKNKSKKSSCCLKYVLS